MKKIIFSLTVAIAAGDAQPLLAQAYPTRAIRFIVPAAPGGGPDVVARLLAPRLAEVFGHQVVVDNRTGANAMIGADLVAKAPPDGYTWLFGTGQNTVNPSLVRKMPHDIIKDFAAVTVVLQAPFVLTVHPSVPAASVRDLINLARSKPGKLNFGSGGVGSAAHLSGELFKTMAKVDFVHIPYKGVGIALSDLLGGQLDLMFPAVASGIPYHKAGRLRGLGVTSPRRHPSIPEVPTIAEAALPGYELRSWYGVLVPAGTPRDIVNRINAAVIKVVNTPEMREMLIAQGTDPETSTPEEFAQFLQEELVRAARVVKASGAKPE